MQLTELKAPYLIFLGSETNETYAKTGAGVAHWSPEKCMGQFHLEGGSVDLGLEEHSIESAANQGAKTLLIGTAMIGGGIPESWTKVLVTAMENGMDIVAGVHSRLNDIEELVLAAKANGVNLIDVRVPPKNLPVGNGKKRTGKRLLTVGTDCALGKKYTALAIDKELRNQGQAATFRASGQTGIMISGSGIPIDAVVADFVSGAAETLSPDNDPDHWDIIEGQGSIFHPGYAAVSMGLLIGSQPDAFVVCHQAGRTHISGWPEFELPTIQQVIDRTIDIGKQTNKSIKCVGISVNTSALRSEEAKEYLAALEEEFELPATDPIRFGVENIVRTLQ
ncbi:MAG TPA: N-acetyltransferase DgcN [Aquiluna sp.]